MYCAMLEVTEIICYNDNFFFISYLWIFVRSLLMYVEYSIARHTLMHIHILLQLKIQFRDENKGDTFLGDKLTPKTLWMLHYWKLNKAYGPVMLMETNIAEVKNGQMRKLSTKSNQAKNVCLTIAKR